MRILIVGGTSFVGRAITWAAHEAGHNVTLINRGQSPADIPDGVSRLVGDRSSDLTALSSLSFDATIDVIAYRPNDVRVLAEALDGRGGHHLQISSISSYQDPANDGATEDDAVLWDEAPEEPDAPITETTYGPLKAACERAAGEYFGAKLTIVRPTFVIGSHDATMRFPYWVQRVRRGGSIAVPGPRSNNLQYIDARDLASFVVTLLQDQTLGAFHAAGPYPAPGFYDVIDAIASHLAPADTNLVEVSPKQILSHHLGSRFPLWTGAQSETALNVNPARALAAGLSLRDLSESVDDVAAWYDGEEPWPASWLTREQEAMLVRSPR